ncbi:MAG: hypothetical protein WC845_00015 [Candidatus Staskawiczbacteria bacterium]|jgi:hypothetical protein
MKASSELFRKGKIVVPIIAVIAALVIFLLIAVIQRFFSEPQSSSSGSVLSLKVNYWLFKEGYATPVITVKNLNDSSWSGCEMTINDDYKTKIADIASIRLSDEVQTIPTTDFIGDSSVPLDYAKNSPRSACVSCFKPQYKTYCGNFKYPSQ